MKKTILLLVLTSGLAFANNTEIKRVDQQIKTEKKEIVLSAEDQHLIDAFTKWIQSKEFQTPITEDKKISAEDQEQLITFYTLFGLTNEDKSHDRE